MRVTERDKMIVWVIAKNGFMTGKQIMLMTGFGGTRATDRRLRKLIEQGWIRRDKKLYGVCGLYTVTHEGMEYFGYNELLNTTHFDKINLNEIEHNLASVDCQIWYMIKYAINEDQIICDKQLRKTKGLQVRQHVPDFVITKGNIAVEIERTYKGKRRMMKNVEDNYKLYDAQHWFTPIARTTIRETLKEMGMRYPGIEIFNLEEVLEYVRCKCNQ